MQQLSLHVVGADHPNAMGVIDVSRSCSVRRVSLIELVPEPKNPVDPNAIAVFSVRRIQIGYLTADRAPWIGGMLRNGREIQRRVPARHAAWSSDPDRVRWRNAGPSRCRAKHPSPTRHEDVEFWPDDLPPDD